MIFRLVFLLVSAALGDATAISHGQRLQQRSRAAAASGKAIVVQPETLPEQGYVGEGVRHMDGKSITSDWGKEYAKHATEPAPQRSSASLVGGGRAAARAVLLAAGTLLCVAAGH